MYFTTIVGTEASGATNAASLVVKPIENGSADSQEGCRIGGA